MEHRPFESWLRRTGPTEVVAALADLLPEVATVVTDGEGRVLHWSRGAEHVFGWTAEEAVGQFAPDGVVCDRPGEQRRFGSCADVRRKDRTKVRVRHWSRCYQGTEGGGGVHVFQIDGDAAASAVAPPEDDVLEFHGLLTRDPATKQVLQMVRNVAETDATVLVRGESGSGKELVARALHAESARRDGPFVAVNCAAFTPSLLASELFGHVKGAFTGASHARPGIFAQAHGGTLFLDEVAELDLELQSKLLRVLQERVVVPVGGTDPVPVDVRVVAATHRALREQVRLGKFREDLLYRLRVVPLFLPPLRERKGDVELLLRDLVARYSSRGPRRVTAIAPEVMKRLLDHDWPGNVRELQNVVEYAFAVGRGAELTLQDLPPEWRGGAPSRPPAASPRPVVDDDRVRSALDAVGGDLTAAAARLGVSRATFWRMRKRAGLT